MAEDRNSFVDILSGVTAGSLSKKKLERRDVPAAVWTALTTWAESVNIPTDDPDVDLVFYEGSYSVGGGPYYNGSYYLVHLDYGGGGAPPDPFAGDVVIQDGKVLGYSLSVAD